MSAVELGQTFARRMRRRGLISRTMRVALGIAVGAAMMPVQAVKAACCTHCSNYETIRAVGCCRLGFYNDCAGTDCFNDANQWWLWTCCEPNNAKRYCYECCPWSCSYTTILGNCPSAPVGRAAGAAA
jgi:hypothetical protein